MYAPTGFADPCSVLDGLDLSILSMNKAMLRGKNLSRAKIWTRSASEKQKRYLCAMPPPICCRFLSTTVVSKNCCLNSFLFIFGLLNDLFCSFYHIKLLLAQAWYSQAFFLWKTSIDVPLKRTVYRPSPERSIKKTNIQQVLSPRRGVSCTAALNIHKSPSKPKCAVLFFSN